MPDVNAPQQRGTAALSADSQRKSPMHSETTSSPHYRTIPQQQFAKLNNGRSIPLVGLGTWKGQAGEIEHAVQTAIKQGYRHIDCAADYGNEKEVGEGIKAGLASGVVGRDDLFVTSKLWNADHGRVREAYRESCNKFGLEYLDLYLVHWPVTPTQGDTLEPPYKETWQEMEKLVDEGLVRSIGVSNLSIKKLKELLGYAKIKPAVNQVEAHPLFRNDELIAFCKEQDIHVTAYSPLGSQDSAISLKRKFSPSLIKDPVVTRVAKDLGKDPGQVLIRWAVQRGTSVLPKSVKDERIKTNIEVFDFEIPADAFKELSSWKLQLRMVDGSVFLHPASPWRSLNDLWDDPKEDDRVKEFARSTYDLEVKQPKIKLNSGDEIPQLGLGTWNAEPGVVKDCVMQSLRCGYRHIDCAEAYKNENEVGDALHEIFEEGVIQRKDVWVTSKLWNDHHSKEDVAKAARNSLKALQLEYLDLYLMHFPAADNEGPTVEPSIQETWQAMEKLVDEKLVRNIGVSNFSVPKLKALLEYARIKPAVNQVEVHPYLRNDEVLAFCKEQGIHVSAYSPLGSPGNADQLGHKVVLLDDPVVQEISKKVGKPPANVLLRWGLQRGCSVLAKSVNTDRIKSNLDVANWELSDEDFQKLSSLKTVQRVVHGGWLLKEKGPYRTKGELWDTDEK